MLDLSPHRDVIGVQAPLGEQLLHVTENASELPTRLREEIEHFFF
jgi:hypothetical protein